MSIVNNQLKVVNQLKTMLRHRGLVRSGLTSIVTEIDKSNLSNNAKNEFRKALSILNNKYFIDNEADYEKNKS